MFPQVTNLRVTECPIFRDDRGSLGVAELAKVVGFSVRRLFWIYGVPWERTRGGHAHKACHQFMICLSGRISVEAFDGSAERTFVLPAGCGIHIPPAIYATERFDGPSSMLAVLCDLPYDKNDYIYERAELVGFRCTVPR